MEFLEKLSLAGLVPVIAVNDADDAVPLCKALSDGGLPVAEITFRTAAAEEAIRRVKPVMLTAVHCETPSGTLNPIGLLGKLKKDLGVPLFYVDTVAGLGGGHGVDDGAGRPCGECWRGGDCVPRSVS